MTTLLKTGWRRTICLVAAYVVMASAISAFAVAPSEILKVAVNQTFTGACCFAWGESVVATQPAKLAPVIVTFDSDFMLVSKQAFNIGVQVNGGPCRLDLGPSTISELHVDNFWFIAGSWEWLIEPTDGLRQGKNTFALCGGGPDGASTITLGYNTLAVRISK